VLGLTDFVGTRRNQEEEEEDAPASCATLLSYCHVPSFSLHARTSSLVELYTRLTVCGVVDVAILSPLALSKHWLFDEVHWFDCLCYHTVLLCFFGRKYELVFYSLTYIKMSVHDKFFPTSRWSEDSILNQVVEEAVRDPQVIVVVTTPLLLNNKILQQNPVGI
jgi:hypothetical protein